MYTNKDSNHISYTFHIYAISLPGTCGTCMSISVNSINHMTKIVHTFQTTFCVISINMAAPLKIYVTLPSFYMDIYIQHWCIYVTKHKKLQHLLHTIATHLPEANMHSIFHICHTFQAIYGECTCIYVTCYHHTEYYATVMNTYLDP